MKDRKSRRRATAIKAPADAGPQPSGKPTPATSGLTDPRFHGLWIGFALCALTLLAYSNSFRVGFVLDNKGLLLQDPRIREATGRNLALIFQHTYWWPIGEAGIYRPLTTLSYLFNYAILGDADQAAGYHWVNLLLHMANVLLVFAVGRRLLGRLAPSALLAALWAVHPASTESVTNIIGRSDLLAAMATLGGFLIYLKSTAAGPRRLAWLVGLGMVTAAGVESKESAVMIVAVITLYELAWPGRQRWRDLLYGLVATGIPVGGMLLQRAAVLAGSPPAQFPFTDNPIADADFWTGRLTALKVMAHYLAQAVWPWRLSMDYAYSQIPLGIGSAADYLSLAVTLLAAAGLAVLWRWNRRAFFLAGFALLVFLPTSNLVIPIGAIRADRFLYLPSVGVLGCMVMAVYGLGSRIRSPRVPFPLFAPDSSQAAPTHRRQIARPNHLVQQVGTALVAPAILLVITAGFAVRTWARNAEWRDELTLASADVRTSPRSFKLHRLLASTRFAADPSHADIDRVLEEIDKSLAIVDPLPDLRNVPETYDIAGAAYLAQGNRLQKAGAPGVETAYRRARQLLERCIQINEAYERQTETISGKLEPGVMGRTKPEAYRLLAGADQRLGDMDGALLAAQAAQRLAPQDSRLYNQIADLLLMRQRGNEAAVVLMEGMLITSDPGLRSNLVTLYGSSTDPANCTLVPGPNGPAINPRCQIVRDHMCAAAPGVLTALIDTGRRQEAMEKKRMFLSDYRCAPEPLNAVLP